MFQKKKTHFDTISLIPNEPEKDRPRRTPNPHLYSAKGVSRFEHLPVYLMRR
jgi:hypothetical protein